MKMNYSLLIVVAFSSLLLIQAGPSFRGLQEAVAVAAPANNTTVVSPVAAPAVNATTNPTANNTTPPRPVANPYAGYTQINVSDLSASWYNPAVYAAFRHGVNALVQTAIFQQKAPLAVYTVNQWISAWSRVRNSGVSYKFYVKLSSPKGVNIAMNLTVNYNKKQNVNLLGAYNYMVTNIPRGSFPSDGYQFATPAQLHNNSTLQGALKFGAEWMIQKLVDANKIPASNLIYTMSALNRAVYKNQANGTSYRFRTQNVNQNGVQVDTNYTVFCSRADKSCKVTAYWYHGYNYSDAELINATNLTNSTNDVIVPQSNNTAAVLAGNETVTVVNNSTDVVGSADQVVANSTQSAPAADVAVSVAPVVTAIPQAAAKVTVDISSVTAYVENDNSTPLINFNRPAMMA